MGQQAKKEMYNSGPSTKKSLYLKRNKAKRRKHLTKKGGGLRKELKLCHVVAPRGWLYGRDAGPVPLVPVPESSHKEEKVRRGEQDAHSCRAFVRKK